MRGVIWLVLLFVVAVVAATTLGANDGLVSIFWGAWRTDVSLNLAVILVVAACALVMLAWQAFHALITLPERAGQWRALKRERAAEAALREALAEYFGARYGRAAKAAQRALALQVDAPALVGDAQFRMLARLLAAGSAHRLQDRPRRDAVLAQALPAASTGRPSGDEAVRLLAAEWALDDRDAPRALELLDALPAGVARRTQALRLRLQAARQARQPLEALRTARLLANHQAFSPAVAQGLLRALVGEALDTAHDAAQLRRVWNAFDAAERRDPLVACRAAQRAAQLQLAEEGRQWLRPFWDRLSELSREEREAVALAMVDLRSGIGTDWLPRLEQAVQTYGQEPAVLAAAGMALAERQLWGKARRLLEEAVTSPQLAGRARRTAWREMARQAREEGNQARAAECDRAAADID